MGNRPHIEPQKQWNNAVMSYVYCKPGDYTALEGFDEQKHEGNILDYFVYRIAPSKIVKYDTSSDRVAGFLVVGNSEKEVLKKLQYVNSKLKVLDANGSDIMRHDLV